MVVSVLGKFPHNTLQLATESLVGYLRRDCGLTFVTSEFPQSRRQRQTAQTEEETVLLWLTRKVAIIWGTL